MRLGFSTFVERNSWSTGSPDVNPTDDRVIFRFLRAFSARCRSSTLSGVRNANCPTFRSAGRRNHVTHRGRICHRKHVQFRDVRISAESEPVAASIRPLAVRSRKVSCLPADRHSARHRCKPLLRTILHAENRWFLVCRRLAGPFARERKISSRQENDAHARSRTAVGRMLASAAVFVAVVASGGAVAVAAHAAVLVVCLRLLVRRRVWQLMQVKLA